MSITLPCIEEKCLLYASCKHKLIIKCEKLFNLIHISIRIDDMYATYDKVIDQINKFLPSTVRVDYIFGEKYYYIYEWNHKE